MQNTTPLPESRSDETLGLVQEFKLFVHFHPGWCVTPVVVVTLLLIGLFLYADQSSDAFWYELF